LERLLALDSGEDILLEDVFAALEESDLIRLAGESGLEFLFALLRFRELLAAEFEGGIQVGAGFLEAGNRRFEAVFAFGTGGDVGAKRFLEAAGSHELLAESLLAFAGSVE